MTELRMRIHPGRLRTRLLLLLAFTLGLAREAGAQPLAPVVGEPVPYSIGVPEGWSTDLEGDVLSLEDPDEETVIMVSAFDLVAAQTRPASMSEAEARRILTERVMASDSLLLDMLQGNAARATRYPLIDMTLEIGTLGGEKAGWMWAHSRIAGEAGWIRTCLTVVDGILYTLVFMGMGEHEPEQESLVARVRDSFVPADMPEEPGSRR
ncbi:MAG TPA: hypothetical protein VEQ60_09635 [Longimicrobium sp.]|nr:hypothetical protein [Longimicrobium sp.]